MFRPTAALACVALTMTASLATAEPILKPQKYHGPIPQSALFLRVGLLGEANNEEMLAFLDSRTQAPFANIIEDFGNGLAIEGAYMYKPHPRFGVRLNANYTRLSSADRGNMVPTEFAPPDTLAPELDYTREFAVDLFALEASAVYFFADASVKEFQTLPGRGLQRSACRTRSVQGDPGATAETGEAYGEPIERGEWDFSAGVHAVLGALYYREQSVRHLGRGTNATAREAASNRWRR
jgi:hypothetical protein